MLKEMPICYHTHTHAMLKPSFVESRNEHDDTPYICSSDSLVNREDSLELLTGTAYACLPVVLSL